MFPTLVFLILHRSQAFVARRMVLFVISRGAEYATIAGLFINALIDVEVSHALFGKEQVLVLMTDGREAFNTSLFYNGLSVVLELPFQLQYA